MKSKMISYQVRFLLEKITLSYQQKEIKTIRKETTNLARVNTHHIKFKLGSNNLLSSTTN